MDSPVLRVFPIRMRNKLPCHVLLHLQNFLFLRFCPCVLHVCWLLDISVSGNLTILHRQNLISYSFLPFFYNTFGLLIISLDEHLLHIDQNSFLSNLWTIIFYQAVHFSEKDFKFLITFLYFKVLFMSSITKQSLLKDV